MTNYDSCGMLSLIPSITSRCLPIRISKHLNLTLCTYVSLPMISLCVTHIAHTYGRTQAHAHTRARMHAQAHARNSPVVCVTATDIRGGTVHVASLWYPPVTMWAGGQLACDKWAIWP